MSASATRAIPSAPSDRSHRSETWTEGSVNGGNPLGSTPTTSSSPARSKAVTATIPSNAAISTPGIRGASRRVTRITASAVAPIARACGHGLAVPDAAQERPGLREESLRVGREPEQRRELPDDDRQRDAVEVAVPDRHRQEIGDEAHVREARHRAQHPHQDREHPGQGERSVRITGREREDHRGDQRRERRVRSEDEDPRRSRDRVRDQREDRRVEARDRRQASSLRVPHADRDQDRGEDDPGRDVVREP